MKTEWDYTDRAHTYDKRADYSKSAVSKLIQETGCSTEKPVADIGAGTGKLTKMLLQHGLTVRAVEPNYNMRMYGMKNTENQSAAWAEGTGEATGLDYACVYAAFFGSSFNVVNQSSALNEVARILVPGGWFACMWNHRDINDPLQKVIEGLIHSFIPNYDYGLRRQDPSLDIENSGYFSKVKYIEERFLVPMKRDEIIEAWKSHDTLYRQSNGRFDEIISAISHKLTADEYLVPYFTRIWFANFIVDKNTAAT